MGQIMDKIMGGDEGGGDAAVKRQAEGASNPMYQLANLIGQVGSQLANLIGQVGSQLPHVPASQPYRTGR